MMEFVKVTVTKLQAVRRQLETALTLYFDEKDPVSIHTLAAAAYNVLKDLNRKDGGKPMLVKEVSAKQIVEQLGHTPRVVAEILNEPENFFKHADRDADRTLTFNDRQSEVLLFDACGKYGEMTKDFVPIFAAFVQWFTCHYPQTVRPGFEHLLPPPELMEFAKQVTRRQWLDYMLSVLGPDGHAVYRDGGRLVVP
jgi:hypothetical protein